MRHSINEMRNGNKMHIIGESTGYLHDVIEQEGAGSSQQGYE